MCDFVISKFPTAMDYVFFGASTERTIQHGSQELGGGGLGCTVPEYEFIHAFPNSVGE